MLGDSNGIDKKTAPYFGYSLDKFYIYEQKYKYALDQRLNREV